MKIHMFALMLLVLLPVQVFADDLVLVDGRYLQVKLLGATEKALHVKNLDTGGELWIPWALIRETDRDRLMIQYGLKEEERTEVTRPGVRIVTKSGDEYYGVPTTEFDAQSVPDPVTIIHRGRELPFGRKVIRQIEWLEVPALEAYTREQLYEQELAEVQPGEEDFEAHWDLASFCATIGLPEKAALHYLKVKEIDPAYRAEYVQNQVDRQEFLARNQRIVDAIKLARRESYYKRFDRGLLMVDEILAMQELEPNIKMDAELTKETITKRRYEYFKKKVRQGYFKLLENELGKISRDPKAKLKDAQRELRRNVHKNIVAKLAETYGLDPKKEVEKMWEERVVHQPRAASYGSGTFVVLGKAKGAERQQQQLQRMLARAQQEQRGRGGRGGRGGNQNQGGGFNSQTLKLPKPPTKDEWWSKIADSTTRRQWMKAYYAENSKQLEVVGERRYSCQRCGGTGTIKYSGGQGETLPVTCPRCQGHRHDKGLTFK